nr:mitochondrial mRNA pseudouridine synthase Trub2 [Onthophagus taurus]
MPTTDAVKIWNNLKGIICVYKPADVKTNHVRKMIVNRICEGLNELDYRPNSALISIEGKPSTELSVVLKPNLADDPLVVGPRYQFNDLPCSWSNYLGTSTSGVLLLGLKRGTTTTKYIRENKPTRAYRITGSLGYSTDNYYKDGHIVERTTFKHVKLAHIERLLSYMQAMHQKKMFELCGVDIKSQTAYELATKGLIRPINSKIPLIYGLKCIKFDPPDFTIEIQCINEYETYLKALIHEIGTKLNSSAHCTGLQCIRHSYFIIDNALLRHQWNLENILRNKEQCENIIFENSGLLHQKSAVLQ